MGALLTCPDRSRNAEVLVFDFEATMQMIVALAAAGLTLILLGVGVKALFFRRRQLPGTVDPDQLEGLEDRLLTEARSKAQLPGRP